MEKKIKNIYSVVMKEMRDVKDGGAIGRTRPVRARRATVIKG